MESEKVKEIKKALECCSVRGGDCDKCPFIKEGFDCDLYLLMDALKLINELESENAELTNAVVDNLDAYRDGFSEGANLNGRVENKWKEENQQLKDRIAELEKEKKDYYDRLNNLQTYIDNHEEVWKGNTKIHLKEFAKRLKEKGQKSFINVGGLTASAKTVTLHDIDETLKEFI